MNQSLLQLYRWLRQNAKLSAKRHPMYEMNRYAKLFAYIGATFFCIYFAVIGTVMGLAAAKSDAPVALFMLPFLLALDFMMRFGIQQTPAVMVKPYLTLPVSRTNVIDCFLLSMLLSGVNLLWMSFFLPYVFVCFCGGLSFWSALIMLVVMHLSVLLNSQWYLLVRTLVGQNVLWWLLPAAVYGGVVAGVVWCSEDVLDDVLDVAYEWCCTVPTLLVLLSAVVLMFLLNRWLQLKLIYKEISRHERTQLKHVSQLAALNRFGLTGEYLKLEVKSTMRNKAIRSRFIQGVLLITMLSLMCAYTDVYNGAFFSNLWCLYCFVFFGAVNLVKIMGPEGNFIDLIMVHEENILTLLRAKYYFYCAMLVLPLLILLPTAITGKFSWLMILAYLFTASGPAYWMLFQLAVHNKQTLPLNEKLTGKGQFENKLQLIIEFVVFFVPVALSATLTGLLGEDMGYAVLMVIGITFTVAHPLWLRRVYVRMMARRYENLEGFHSTR